MAVTPKFKIGYTVEILSRNGEGGWENSAVGEEAIIECECNSFFDNDGHASDLPSYSLLIMCGDNCLRIINPYEEKFLKLICCNEDRGKKILNNFKNGIARNRPT